MTDLDIITPGTVQFHEGDCREFLPTPADVVITDPPYAVDRHGRMLGQIASNYHGKGAHTRGYYDHNSAKFAEILTPAFDGMLHSLPKGGTLVAFCGNRTFAEMVTIASTVGFEILDVLVFTGGGSFAKSRSMLMPRFELAFYARRPGGTRQINPDRNIANLFDIKKTKGESEHPTTKPQAWMRRVVEVFSEPGDTVLDPFAGSGSTLLAARDLGRNAIGMEQEPEYANIVRRRLDLPSSPPAAAA
ncbi:site-specific DNA-methyltransferase [Curtobacterium sp. MCSS17_016]|uniref:DNA-methyltransferase n=1 Tax=Curtobacterium sp. MCSS17_016 TaxID=2175644 RepID=UPI000DAA4713|nr:site-specific DNA-methyltransferase [Curtobacterium sp. MCSS17_016]WIE81116.1 site-specific DNA-methyltransferase [Curtobacterium sp. MCSS17_016]